MTAKGDLKVEYVQARDLLPYARNSRTHSEQQVAQIAASIREFGFTNPVLISETNDIIAGHGRLLAAQKLGMDTVPCIRLVGLTEAQRRAYVIADNRLALNAGWDEAMLQVELQELNAMEFDLELTGFDPDEIEAMLRSPDDDDATSTSSGDDGDRKGSMAERFGVPPFSVLDARQGYWQERKRDWLAKGIKSELGRGDNLLQFSDACKISVGSGGKPSKFGKCLETGIGEKYGREEMNATSIFDPVICELAYRWFSPPGGTVLDPFAGGSVRGLVASFLGRQYIGVELREEQVLANRSQEELCPTGPTPVWHCGDSQNLKRIAEGIEADFVFSCPPYADLEVYSDDPRDISTMGYPDFLEAYRNIISQAIDLLKPNRFAFWVVGEVRGRDGTYLNFVPDTIKAFEDAGARFYNEAILVTAVGSLPVRAGKAFLAGRKLGKTHQNVLVFCKGDPKKATEACGEIEVYEPSEEFGEEL